MRFITLAQREPRCRPEPPNTILHNDCGKQAHCARRQAANTQGSPTFDFSTTAQPLSNGDSFYCSMYLSAALNSERAGAPK